MGRWLQIVVREIVAALAPPRVDPVLMRLATGPLRPAVPMGRLRGDRSVCDLSEVEPDDGLPDWKLRSARRNWW